MDIILASSSAIRKTILLNAGLKFDIQASQIDERAEVEKKGGERAFSPKELSLFLADLKAKDISKSQPGKLIIGADQVLGFQDRILHKASTIAEGKKRLSVLSGNRHHLYSGVSLCLDGEIIWRHISTSCLFMRSLSDKQIEGYFKKVGEGVLSSVGCYQLEGRGAALFDKIEGDFFSILGLPLLPLLAALREQGLDI